MARVTPILYTHRSNARNESPVYIRIADAGKTRYISLKEYLPPHLWDQGKGAVRRGHPRAAEINKLIADRVAQAYDLVYRLKAEGVAATADHLKEVLSPRDTPKRTTSDFFAFADEVVTALDGRGQVYTSKRYKSICKKLRGYTGEPFPFAALTPSLLRSYETHLVTHYANGPTTVVTNFNAIRTIYYRAIREGLAEQGTNPFFLFSPRRPQRPERGKLSLEEVAAIEALDLPTGSPLWHVRNYFLFSFYCAGVRFGDVATLRWGSVKDGRLEYMMSKTGTKKSIVLLPQASAIVDRYRPIAGTSDTALVFPLIRERNTLTPRRLVGAVGSRNAVVNRQLKEIARRAGVRCHLSFHIARHSFADFCRRRGWSVYDISKALGHANITVTERYLRGFDADALDDKMTTLFC